MSDRLTLCADIGGTHLRVCLATGSEIISERMIGFPPLGNGSDELSVLINIFEDLKKEAPNQPLDYISLALGASIDRTTRRVVSWPNRPHWVGMDLPQLLTARFGVPTLTEDDTNAAALGEFKSNRRDQPQSMAFINVGTGIGCGLILQGKIYRGHRGWAGELGHIIVEPGGKLCICGKSGCLQAYASGEAIIRAQSELNVRRRFNPKISSEVDSRSAEVKKIFSTAANYLGVAIANLIMILDIEEIRIGGGALRAEEDFMEPLKRAVKEALHSRKVNILNSALGNRAGLVGALYLAKTSARIKQNNSRHK